MDIKVIERDGEKILPVCLHGKNRNENVLAWQKRVFSKFNLPLNYVECPFHVAGHGDFAQNIVNQTISFVDYYIFVDMDAIPLKHDIYDRIYERIKDKNTVWGLAWSSNHRSPSHIHCAGCFLGFSKDLYLKVGYPPLHDRIQRSDNFEELSWRAAEFGMSTSLIYPSDYHALTNEEMARSGNPKCWQLGQKFEYGLGTTYSDLIFHAGMQDLPRSSELFISKCKQVLDIKEDRRMEAIITSVNFSDYLSITLPKNLVHFDSIVVVTDPKDVKTQELCKKYGVEYVITDEFYSNGAKFNKGKAITRGIKSLKYKDWVVFLDGDIILPSNFREKINLNKINKEKFYGSGRRFVTTFNDYAGFIDGTKRIEDFEYIEGAGCGFFQLVSLRSSKAKYLGLNNLYNDSFNADQVDIDFLKKFCPLVENDPNLVRVNMDLIHLGPHGMYRDGRDPNDSFFTNK